MNLDRLNYFLETAKHEHLGLASKALNVSPSAISHSIRLLEEEFGQQLFEKRGKRIFLTNHGRLLMTRARSLLETFEEMKEELTSSTVELRGHYRVAATHGLSSLYLGPAWAKVQKRHPHLTVEIAQLRSGEVLARLLKSEIDLGVLLCPEVHPDLVFQVIQRPRLIFAARREHPIVQHAQRSKGASGIVRLINRYPCAAPKSYSGIQDCEQHPLFPQFGIQPRAQIVYDSYDNVASIIGATDHWTLMPDFMVERYSDVLAPIHLPGWKFELEVVAARLKSRIETRVIQELLKSF